MPMLDNQVRSVGFAHEANSSDDRLIQAAVSRGQSPRYGLQKTEMVGRILESDELFRFISIAHNRNCRIQESDLPFKPLFLTFQTTPNPKKPSEPTPLKGISTTRKENP